MNAIYWTFRVLFIIVYKLLFRFRSYGSANIPPAGGVIIAPNHLSYLDPPLVGIGMKRRATYMAKASLFRNRLIGWFVHSFSIPVDYDKLQPSTVKEAVRRLRHGEVVVIFPEGGRITHGDIAEGKRGVATIAAMSGAVVVPAYIDGTDRALPVHGRYPRPVHVSITYGRPMAMEAGESERHYLKRIVDDIMGEIKKLKDERRGVSAI